MKHKDMDALARAFSFGSANEMIKWAESFQESWIVGVSLGVLYTDGDSGIVFFDYSGVFDLDGAKVRPVHSDYCDISYAFMKELPKLLDECYLDDVYL
jgi:hypothetical protein